MKKVLKTFFVSIAATLLFSTAVIADDYLPVTKPTSIIIIGLPQNTPNIQENE